MAKLGGWIRLSLQVGERRALDSYCEEYHSHELLNLQPNIRLGVVSCDKSPIRNETDNRGVWFEERLLSGLESDRLQVR